MSAASKAFADRFHSGPLKDALVKGALFAKPMSNTMTDRVMPNCDGAATPHTCYSDDGMQLGDDFTKHGPCCLLSMNKDDQTMAKQIALGEADPSKTLQEAFKMPKDQAEEIMKHFGRSSEASTQAPPTNVSKQPSTEQSNGSDKSFSLIEQGYMSKLRAMSSSEMEHEMVKLGQMHDAMPSAAVGLSNTLLNAMLEKSINNEAGEFKINSTLGQRFGRFMKKAIKAKEPFAIEYEKAKGDEIKRREVRARWAMEKFDRLKEVTKHAEEHKVNNYKNGRYMNITRIGLKEGGERWAEDEECVKGVFTLVAKCLLLGEHYVSVNPQMDRMEFLCFERGLDDGFIQSWQKFEEHPHGNYMEALISMAMRHACSWWTWMDVPCTCPPARMPSATCMIARPAPLPWTCMDMYMRNDMHAALYDQLRLTPFT